MDVRQLTALVAIADHGSFSAAARALHTVQSNVSAHIAKLESEVDAVLVDRSDGSLTAEGDAVVARARRVLAEMDAIAPDIAATRNEISGIVRLGVIGTTARWLVPPLVQRVATDYPLIRLQIVDATTTSLVPLVVSGELQLAVVNLPVAEPGIDATPLFTEALVLAGPADHDLLQQRAIDLAVLAATSLLLPPRGTAFRDEVEDAVHGAGLELRPPRVEVDGVMLLSALVGAGHGLALLPTSAVPVGGPVRTVAVTGLRERSVGLIGPADIRPSATSAAVAGVVDAVVADHVRRRNAPNRTGARDFSQ